MLSPAQRLTVSPALPWPPPHGQPLPPGTPSSSLPPSRPMPPPLLLRPLPLVQLLHLPPPSELPLPFRPHLLPPQLRPQPPLLIMVNVEESVRYPCFHEKKDRFSEFPSLFSGWTGPTVCASPYTCQISNQYVSSHPSLLQSPHFNALLLCSSASVCNWRRRQIGFPSALIRRYEITSRPSKCNKFLIIPIISCIDILSNSWALQVQILKP